jgi:hypothetical protein
MQSSEIRAPDDVPIWDSAPAKTGVSLDFLYMPDTNWPEPVNALIADVPGLSWGRVSASAGENDANANWIRTKR